MNISIERTPLDEATRQALIELTYPVIHSMHFVHKNLGPGLPEYIYQEALYKHLQSSGLEAVKEYKHHPVFCGERLESFVRMDLIVRLPQGNVIIECKSIAALSEKERFQTFGYLRATEFSAALLVNFGTWPKAQIERYCFCDGLIRAF